MVNEHFKSDRHQTPSVVRDVQLNPGDPAWPGAGGGCASSLTAQRFKATSQEAFCQVGTRRKGDPVTLTLSDPHVHCGVICNSPKLEGTQIVINR